MTSQAATAKSTATDKDSTVKLSPEEAAIQAQLDAIFGTPKKLTAEEQKQVDALSAQIDTLIEGAGEKGLTAAQEKTLDGLVAQIDTLYGVKSYDSLTDAEKKQADALFEKLIQETGGDATEVELVNPETEALFKQLDDIFGTPKELNAEQQKQADAIDAQITKLFEDAGDKELSKEDEAKLAELETQLDTLYGVKSYASLTDEQKKTVDDIYKKLDATEGVEGEDGMTVDAETEALFKQLDDIFGTPKELNADEQKQADAIDAQITKLFEDAGDKELSKEDEAKLAELETQLDTLYGVKSYASLTDEQKKTVDGIYEKLDAKEGGEFGGEIAVDAETEALFKQLDDILGTPKELSADEQKQADGIDAQITKLFEDAGDKELSKEDEAKLAELETQLDTLYGVKSYASLTDEQKKTVDGIYEKLDAKEENDFGGELVSFEGLEFLSGENNGETGTFEFDMNDSSNWAEAFTGTFDDMMGDMGFGGTDAFASAFGGEANSGFGNFGADLQLTGQADTMPAMDFFSM